MSDFNNNSVILASSSSSYSMSCVSNDDDGDRRLGSSIYYYYNLGQVIPFSVCEGKSAATSQDVLGSKKFKAFGCVMDNGDVRVGITGEFFMERTDVVEKALMIFGSNPEVDVAMIPMRRIFNLSDNNNNNIKLKLPDGYGVWANPSKNLLRFSVTQVMQGYWDAQAPAGTP
jgi:hypothetical protein